MAIIQDDLRRTIHFAKNHNEEFLQTLRKDAEAKTKKELAEIRREIESSEERICKLDKKTKAYRKSALPIGNS